MSLDLETVPETAVQRNSNEKPIDLTGGSRG